VAGLEHGGEAVHHPGRILEAVPAGDLDDELGVGARDLALADDLAASPDLSLASVEPFEGRRGRLLLAEARRRQQARAAEDRAHPNGLHVLVLRREGVDRGRYDCRHHPLAAGWHVRAPGEDHRIGPGHVGGEECPGGVGEFVALVGTDVAAPDDGAPGLDQVGDQTCRLRIVQEGDVVLARLSEHAGSVFLADPFEWGALGEAEPTAVADLAVHVVVEALGQREEVRRAGDRQPAHVDADAARQADPGPEHLRHSPARGGGVDVPYLAAVEQLGGASQAGFEALARLLVDHAEQPLQRERRDVYLARGHGFPADLPTSRVGSFSQAGG